MYTREKCKGAIAIEYIILDMLIQMRQLAMYESMLKSGESVVDSRVNVQFQKACVVHGRHV